MDNTTLFLRIKALSHAIDFILSHQGTADSEDIDILSSMLVETVDEYDTKRT